MVSKILLLPGKIFLAFLREREKGTRLNQLTNVGTHCARCIQYIQTRIYSFYSRAESSSKSEEVEIGSRDEAICIPEESFQKSVTSGSGFIGGAWMFIVLLVTRFRRDAVGRRRRKHREKSQLLFMAILILKWYLMSHRHQGRSIW